MDPLAFVLALAPILWLVVALLAFRLPAWKAAAGSFAIACALAMARWGMGPAEVATASLEGFLMALWPIVLVIVAAVFTYNLCVSTGAMDVIGHMIASVSSDRRILALLIAWCFGGFMEGMAGFGTAVAIPAGMLAGMGFDPHTSIPFLSMKSTSWLYTIVAPSCPHTANAPPTFPLRPRSPFSSTSIALSRKVCIMLGQAFMYAGAAMIIPSATLSLSRMSFNPSSSS